MFIDQAPPNTVYDIAIIGAGPAGITIAHECIGAGLRVLLIESGGMEFDDRTQELYDGPVTGLEDTDLVAGRLRYFGGTSNHWGGHCLPLDPVDFARPPNNGMSGWPFPRKALDPYYERAHLYCDLGKYDYRAGSASGVSDGDLLLPGHESLETSVIRQSAPTLFGEKYAASLRSAENIHVLLQTNAVYLDSDDDGRITGVGTATLNGREARIEARLVVVACGAVENARLLLASNARGGRSFGDTSGFLGACYMDHVAGGAGFLHLSDPVGPKAYWTEHHGADGVPVHHVWRLADSVIEREKISNTQFFVLPFSADESERRRAREAGLALRSLKSIAKWTLGRDQGPKFRLSEAYCDFINNADSFVVQHWSDMTDGDAVRQVLLRYEAEQLPDRTNRVQLAETRDALGQPRAALHWSPSIADRDSIVRSTVLIGQICGAAGLGHVELEDHFDARYWDASTTHHALGTTRMAETASNGVVDPDALVYGTRNLYVAGGSVMPTGGRANPTLTIVALSVRLADHLKSIAAAR